LLNKNTQNLYRVVSLVFINRQPFGRKILRIFRVNQWNFVAKCAWYCRKKTVGNQSFRHLGTLEIWWLQSDFL